MMAKKKKKKVARVHTCCDEPMRTVMATEARLSHGRSALVTLLRCGICKKERQVVAQILPAVARQPKHGNPGHAPSGLAEMVLPPAKLARFTPREKRNNGRSDE